MKNKPTDNPAPYIINEDKPETRLAARGSCALLDAEALALAAGFKTDGADLRALLENFGSITAPDLINASLTELARFVPQEKARRLAAVYEVVKRAKRAEQVIAEHLDTPQKVYDYVAKLFPHDREACMVLALNRRNRLLRAAEVISVGTATSALMHPREVLRFAIRSGATAFIICHNHPSGDPTPSPADRATTKQINEAGGLIGIEMLDHVICGTPTADPAKKGWFSFGEAGLL